MRAAVNLFASFGAALALGGGVPQAASADGEPSADEAMGAGRWVPSLAVTSGFAIQKWEGDIQSRICRDCTIPGPGTTALREPTHDDDIDVTPFVGGTLELMTPTIPIPTSPRLFVGGDVLAAFGIERIIAGEGNPGIARSPLPPGNADTGFDDAGALGQGSRIRAQMDTLMLGANAGIAFPLQFRGRNLMIRPSFGWLRYEIDVEGVVVDAECAPPLSGNVTECNENKSGGFLRPIVLKTDGSETFDAIGPGLDIALDTGRVGPLGTSLFLGVRAYQVMGDRNVDLPSPSMAFSDPAGDDTTDARFDFEIDRWLFRAALGLRIHWLGSGD